MVSLEHKTIEDLGNNETSIEISVEEGKQIETEIEEEIESGETTEQKEMKDEGTKEVVHQRKSNQNRNSLHFAHSAHVFVENVPQSSEESKHRDDYIYWKTAKNALDPIKTLKESIKKTQNENKPIRELIACIKYLMLVTRPDLSAGKNFCSYQNKSTEHLWASFKRILRYIKGTSDTINGLCGC